MKRIVREHYPVAELPENLREGFAADGKVRVIVEPQQQDSQDFKPSKKPFSLEGLFAQARPSFASSQEIAVHLDAMRDEWSERR